MLISLSCKIPYFSISIVTVPDSKVNFLAGCGLPGSPLFIQTKLDLGPVYLIGIIQLGISNGCRPGKFLDYLIYLLA